MNRQLRRRRNTLAVLASIATASTASGQTTYEWVHNSSNWLDPNNWVPNSAYPGTLAAVTSLNTDIASIANVTSTISINFNPGNTVLSLGAIDYSGFIGGTFAIQNSSGTSNGTLTLYGATINGIANTIISLDGATDLTLTGNTVRLLTLQLGTANSVIQVAANRLLVANTPISQVANNSRFTLTGGGILALTGSQGSTFNGGITVEGGSTLRMSANNQLGNNVGNALGYITLDNGTLHIVTGNLTSNRTIALGAGGGTIQQGNGSGTTNVPFPMVISGIGRLNVTGLHKNLTANNTFSGGLTLTSTQLGFFTDSNLGAVPESLMANNIIALNSELRHYGNSITISANRGMQIGNPAGNGAGSLTFSLQNPSATVTFNGPIAQRSNVTGSLNLLGGGTLVLGGDLTYTGPTSMVGFGTLVFAGTVASTSTIVANGSLKLDFSADTAPINNILNPSGSLRLGSQSDTTHFLIQGAPEQSNTQTLSGNLTLQAGLIQIQAATGLGGSLSVIVGSTLVRNNAALVTFSESSNGLFQITANTSFSGPSGLLKSTANAAFATMGTSDWAARMAGNVVVTGSSIPGFYTPSTPTNLTNNADVDSGTDTTLFANTSVASVRFDQANENRTITLTAGTTLSVGGVLVTPAVGAANSTITGGDLRPQGNTDFIVFQNNPSGPLVVGSRLLGNAGLSKAGSGTLILSGTGSNFTGNTSLYEGVIQAGANNAFSPNSNVAMSANTTLRLNGYDQKILNPMVSSSSVGNTITIENGGNTPATLTVGASSGSATYFGNIRNGGPAPLSLTKVGNSSFGFSFSLNSQPTVNYTGTTTVLQGTLSYALGFVPLGNFIVGNNTVPVGNVPTLGLSGNIAGHILVRGNGVLNINSTGTLQMNATLGATFEPSGIYQLAISSIGTSDRINILGSSTLKFETSGNESPVIQLDDVTFFSRATPGNYTVFTLPTASSLLINGSPQANGTILGWTTVGNGSGGPIEIDTSLISTLVPGDTFTLWLNGNNIILSYNTPVPEPTFAFSLTVGVMGIISHLRRRRRLNGSQELFLPAPGSLR